jgi:hypothetical protein
MIANQMLVAALWWLARAVSSALIGRQGIERRFQAIGARGFIFGLRLQLDVNSFPSFVASSPR